MEIDGCYVFVVEIGWRIALVCCTGGKCLEVVCRLTLREFLELRVLACHVTVCFRAENKKNASCSFHCLTCKADDTLPPNKCFVNGNQKWVFEEIVLFLYVRLCVCLCL